jgi:hypothetical protein
VVLCFTPYIFLEIFAGVYWGRQKKQVERLFFCIGIIRFDLALHMMIFPYCIFFNKKKKNWEEFAGYFFSWLIR